jgi:FAD/FMN-containing dehydrogenase
MQYNYHVLLDAMGIKREIEPATLCKAVGAALNAQFNAKIVAFFKTPEDVALGIVYVKKECLPIAIRGGGHNTAGASSTQGLVIDLSRHLNAVEIDPENKLAYVGGGAI